MKNKYCLKSTVQFSDINKSSVNRSKSKQTFSFCKSQRFQTIQANCPKNTYDRDVLQRKNSGISIGRGQRSDFTKVLTSSPGASKYNLKSQFQEKDTRIKGYSLRMSRDEVNFGSYLNKQLISIPAPTRYNYEKKQRTRSPSYTLRAKTKIFDKSKTIEAQNENPGPGNYDNPQIDMNSNYAFKFSNIGFTSSRSKRFISNKNNVPGPGNYQQISSLSKVGKYILSNHTGGTKAIFDHSKRVSKFQEIKLRSKQNPGPGYYRLPSEFGHYDGDVYQNTRTLNTSRYSKRVYSKRD